MWNINAPQGRIPCAIFTKFAEFVPNYRCLVVKIWLNLLEGLWSYGVISSGCLVPPNFQRPPSGETTRQTPEVLEVQERARRPLSPCQVWWGSDFTRRRDSQKR